MKIAVLIALALIAGCAQKPNAGCAPDKNNPTAVADPAKCPQIQTEGDGVNTGAGPATSAQKQPDGSVKLK